MPVKSFVLTAFFVLINSHTLNHCLKPTGGGLFPEINAELIDKTNFALT
jgi:hypothetical protein